MKKFTQVIAISLFVTTAFAQTIRFDQKTLFVKMNPGMEVPELKEIDQVDHLFGDNYVLTTKNVVALENKLLKLDSVARTEKNYFAGTRQLPQVSFEKSNIKSFESQTFNDPQVGKIWAFKGSESNGISVEKAYTSALPNRAPEKIIVAVVDTGVDYNHEDLKDVMWVNSGEVAANGIDDDYNGYVDDIHGIDTIKRDANGNATGDPINEHYHGTHVAGSIGATQNNSKGIAGIAGNVEIMAIRTVPGDGDETDLNVVESYLYAAKNGAKLINCSFGKSVNEGGMIVSESIEHVGKEYGVLVVAAAGNDSTPWAKWDIDTKFKYPASYNNKHLMVIAATQATGTLASFSNVGKKNVDLASPGQDVFSTMPGNKYGNLSGTSMATPIAVGAAAQVLSFYPELTPLQLKSILMNSVVTVPAFANYMVTGGRIDLFNALELAKKSK